MGCRFGFSDNLALNFGIGYTMQKISVDWYGGYEYYGSSKENIGGFSIKLGLEF